MMRRKGERQRGRRGGAAASVTRLIGAIHGVANRALVHVQVHAHHVALEHFGQALAACLPAVIQLSVVRAQHPQLLVCAESEAAAHGMPRTAHAGRRTFERS